MRQKGTEIPLEKITFFLAAENISLNCITLSKKLSERTSSLTSVFDFAPKKKLQRKRAKETKTNDMMFMWIVQCCNLQKQLFLFSFLFSLFTSTRNKVLCTIQSLEESLLHNTCTLCSIHCTVWHGVMHMCVPVSALFLFRCSLILHDAFRTHDVIQLVLKFDTIFKVYWMKKQTVMLSFLLNEKNIDFLLTQNTSIPIWTRGANFPVHRCVHDLIEVQCTNWDFFSSKTIRVILLFHFVLVRW